MTKTEQSIKVKKETLSVEERVSIAFQAADSKKALEIVCLNISEISTIADYFIICGASSSRQIFAVADEIEKRMRKIGEKKYHVEGKKEGYWVLMDFGDLIIHIFHKDKRSFYDLERLWGNAKKVDFT